jgi:hypothetical protein
MEQPYKRRSLLFTYTRGSHLRCNRLLELDYCNCYGRASDGLWWRQIGHSANPDADLGTKRPPGALWDWPMRIHPFIWCRAGRELHHDGRTLSHSCFCDTLCLLLLSILCSYLVHA